MYTEKNFKTKKEFKQLRRPTISTLKLFEMLPDEETARQYLEARLWPEGTRCPECRATGRITARKQGYYRCNACKLDFTVRTGTIFERSHIPLRKWIYAMYLLLTARKGISSMQLAKEIGVTQKSAWFMLQRLREAFVCPQLKMQYVRTFQAIFLSLLAEMIPTSCKATLR